MPEPSLFFAVCACVPWIIKAIVYIRSDGVRDGSAKQMSLQQALNFQNAIEVLRQKLERHEDITRKEIDELVKSVSVNTDMTNERYHEFYKEFQDFRFQVARYMKNGGTQ